MDRYPTPAGGAVGRDAELSKLEGFLNPIGDGFRASVRFERVVEPVGLTPYPLEESRP